MIKRDDHTVVIFYRDTPYYVHVETLTSGFRGYVVSAGGHYLFTLPNTDTKQRLVDTADSYIKSRL